MAKFTKVWFYSLLLIISNQTTETRPISEITVTFKEQVKQQKSDMDDITITTNIKLLDYQKVKQLMIKNGEIQESPRSKRNINEEAHTVIPEKIQLIPQRQSKYYPEYGLLLNNHGYIVPGIRRTYMFAAVKIPKPRIFEDKTLPAFPSCELLISRIKAEQLRRKPHRIIDDALYAEICDALAQTYYNVVQRTKQ